MAKSNRDLPVVAFKSQAAWDDWLASQDADSSGLWLKLAKVSSGIASVSKAEAIDTALCHGWIDGQLDSFDRQVFACPLHAAPSDQQVVGKKSHTRA